MKLAADSSSWSLIYVSLMLMFSSESIMGDLIILIRFFFLRLPMDCYFKPAELTLEFAF